MGIEDGPKGRNPEVEPSPLRSVLTTVHEWPHFQRFELTLWTDGAKSVITMTVATQTGIVSQKESPDDVLREVEESQKTFNDLRQHYPDLFAILSKALKERELPPVDPRGSSLKPLLDQLAKARVMREAIKESKSNLSQLEKLLTS